MTDENLLYSIVMFILEKKRATHSSTLAWRSLVGYSPWGRKESVMTEAT